MEYKLHFNPNHNFVKGKLWKQILRSAKQILFEIFHQFFERFCKIFQFSSANLIQFFYNFHLQTNRQVQRTKRHLNHFIQIASRFPRESKNKNSHVVYHWINFENFSSLQWIWNTTSNNHCIKWYEGTVLPKNSFFGFSQSKNPNYKLKLRILCMVFIVFWMMKWKLKNHLEMFHQLLEKMPQKLCKN